MYTWPQLKEMWEHDKLTTEQVIGQLLVWGEQEQTLAVQEQRQREGVAREVAQLKQAVKALNARLKAVETQIAGGR